MMKDDEVEDLLRRVRPAGPPAELRARIVAARPERRAWPWAMAAAALLLLTVTLQFMGAALREEFRPDAAVPRDIEAELASSVRDALGVSEQEARAIAMLQVIRTTIDARGAQERQQ